MEIKTLEIAGFMPAMHAMRNPMDSWKKNDSAMREFSPEEVRDVYGPYTPGMPDLGPNDTDLASRLQAAGPEHAKHLRLIQVWADVYAPRYWWQEMDTYRAGVEKLSCSTMHKLMARPLALSDFACDDAFTRTFLEGAISDLNAQMALYRSLPQEQEEARKLVWRGIIQALPQSYQQRRTMMFSYAALRNVYHQRKNHKLSEWHQFCRWCESLPESWMIKGD